MIEEQTKRLALKFDSFILLFRLKFVDKRMFTLIKIYLQFDEKSL